MNLTTSPQPVYSRHTASKALNRRLRKNHQVPEDQLVFTESAGLESRSKKDVFTNRSQYIRRGQFASTNPNLAFDDNMDLEAQLTKYQQANTMGD